MPWEADVVRERAMPTLSGANDGILGAKAGFLSCRVRQAKVAGCDSAMSQGAM